MLSLFVTMKMSLYNKEFYENDYQIKVVDYYLRNWDDFKMHFHTHERVEIMYVLKGQCSVDVMDDKFKFVSGEMILVDAGVSHKIILDDNEHCRMFNIEFVFEPSNSEASIGFLLGEDFINTKFIQDKRDYVMFKEFADIYSYLNLIVGELSGTGSEKLIQLQCAQILLKISEEYEKLNTTKRVKTVVYVNKALRYMNTHYSENIKAEDIAQSAGVNKNYLQRRFKDDMGQTILEYLNLVRINKAKQLLENTDIQIADLCLLVGINSRQYFTYLFKKHLGISPQKYRQNFLNASWE